MFIAFRLVLLLESEGAEPDVSQIECANWLFDQLEVQAGVSVTHLAEFNFVDMLLALHPRISTIRPNKDRVFYWVDPNLAQHFAVFAFGNPDLAELVRLVCKANIFNGEPVPEAFRPHCMRWIDGASTFAPRRGPKAGKEFGIIFVARQAVQYLADAYCNGEVARGDDKIGSPCDTVAEVLAARGFDCQYTTVRDWMQHPKHRSTRLKANVLTGILNENTLQSLGVLRPAKFPIAGIPAGYGPIPGMGRMT